MRKLISLMHVSLDGFCAGPKGEMDWISLNDAIFADVTGLIEGAGAAVYGRTTYGMMRGYWPALLDKADADRDGAACPLGGADSQTHFLAHPGRQRLEQCAASARCRRDSRRKQRAGADLLIFGSPGLVQAFLALDVIDEYLDFPESGAAGRGHSLFSGRASEPAETCEHKPFDERRHAPPLRRKENTDAQCKSASVPSSMPASPSPAIGTPSPARVFQAFADEEAKDKWFAGRPDWTPVERSFDFREGGEEHAAGRWKTGMVSSFDCVYRDIVAPNGDEGRIIYSYVMHLDDRKISVSQACDRTQAGKRRHQTGAHRIWRLSRRL